MSIIQQLIDKWEADNEKLEPQTKISCGSIIPTGSIMAYQIKLNCINDLKQHQKEAMHYASKV
jgi:hypothetical protein